MSAPQPTIMKGGARQYVADLGSKFKDPISIFTAAVLILATVYHREIPIDIKFKMTSTVSKILLFFVTLYVGIEISWVHGLLMALFVSILIATSPRKIPEAFADIVQTKMVGDDKQRWFIERVLNENPMGIQKDRVLTQAAQ
jgi:hypothetical protein